MANKVVKHEAFGITIVFVRKDNCENYGKVIESSDPEKPDVIADPIREIVDQYRKNERYLNSKNAYFEILELDVFGYFDKVYIYLNHTFNLSARHLHSASSFLRKNYRFHSKIITGFISTAKNETISLSGGELAKSRQLFDQLKMLMHKDQSPYSFVFISRIKLNSKFLYKIGGLYVSRIKDMLAREFDKINDPEKSSINKEKGNKGTCEYLFIDSFGFSELILITYWNDFRTATNSVFALRDVIYGDNILEEKGYKDEDKLKRDIAALADLRNEPCFDSWSTTVASIKESFFNQDGLQLHTRWSLKPGSLNSFENSLVNKGFATYEKMFGWQDTMTNNIFSQGVFKSSEDRHKFLLENIHHIDAVNTIVALDPVNSLKTNSESETLDHNTKSKAIIYGDEKPVLEGNQLISSPGDPAQSTRIDLSQLVIDHRKIKMMENKLYEMGVSYVVVSRIVNSVGNFNKSMGERENQPFFIFLEEYLNRKLIDNINAYYETFSNRIHEDIFNLRMLERTLIKICKGFESAFSNRYMHSQELSESPDTNFSYKGGIQQYLLIYEHLFRSTYRRIIGLDSPGVSLYVSGYSSTESTKHVMRLNIFQIYEPALFIVALAHEISIHYFDLVIADYYSSLSPADSPRKMILDRDHSSLQKYSTSDILYNFARIGVYKKDDLFHNVVYNLLFRKSELTPERVYSVNNSLENIKKEEQKLGGFVTSDNFLDLLVPARKVTKDALQYLFTDLVTYHTTFNKDIELFIYWHTIYSLQLVANMRPSSREYRDELMSLMIRFEFLKLSVGETKTNVKKYLDDHVLNTNVTKDCELVNKIVLKIRHDEATLVSLIMDLQSAMPFWEPIDAAKFKEKGSIAAEPFSSASTEEERLLHERKLMLSYLYHYKRFFPNIAVNSSEKLLDRNEKTEKAMIANGYGGSFVITDEAKERNFVAKVDFLRTIWHISYMYKGYYLLNERK